VELVPQNQSFARWLGLSGQGYSFECALNIIITSNGYANVEPSPPNLEKMVVMKSKVIGNYRYLMNKD